MSDESVVRVVLLRHGKTASNIEKRYAGRRNDDPLHPEGVRELERIAPQFRALMGDGALLFSGQSKRCFESARILSSFLSPKREPLVVERLTEIDFGGFEGKTYAELADDPRYRAWLDSNGTASFPNGESRERFVKRTVDALENVVGFALAARFKAAAYVCHGGNIMAIMSELTEGGYYEYHAANLEGYILKIRQNDEGIHDITYDRIMRGDNR